MLVSCDVAALKSFLTARKTDTSKLFTIDLICYGPTLHEVHEQYIAGLERRYRSPITNFTVRFKKRGWTPLYLKAEFENNRTFCEPFYESDYGKAFSMYARSVCYGCRFKGDGHQSDITIGDYWGLTPDMPGYNHNGVSVFLVHTERGQEPIDRIDTQEFTLQLAEASLKDSFKHG